MNYPATGKWIVRDSAIETYHGGEDDISTVRWSRCIYNPEGNEVDGQIMQRDFDSNDQADVFAKVMYNEFQRPAFATLESGGITPPDGVTTYSEGMKELLHIKNRES